MAREELVDIVSVVFREDLYPRVSEDWQIVAKYKDALKIGAVFPAIEVAAREGILILIDGEAEPESARGWEAERGSYRMTNGPTKDGKPDGKTALCIPQDVLWGCFTRACSNFKVKISGKMRPASNVFPSILRLPPAQILDALLLDLIRDDAP